MKLAQLKAAVNDAYERCRDPHDTVITFASADSGEQHFPDIEAVDLHENADEQEPELLVFYIKVDG